MGDRRQDNVSTRRDFLKAVGIGSLALTTTGSVSGLLSGCNSSTEPEWDISADIVVVGSGAAASSAAITAREQGAWKGIRSLFSRSGAFSQGGEYRGIKLLREIVCAWRYCQRTRT